MLCREANGPVIREEIVSRFLWMAVILACDTAEILLFMALNLLPLVYTLKLHRSLQGTFLLAPGTDLSATPIRQVLKDLSKITALFCFTAYPVMKMLLL